MYDPSTSHPIDCRTAVERLWTYLDRELDAGAAGEVEAHLDACADCPPHFDFARTLLAEIRSQRAAPGDVGVLRLRVRQSLLAAGFRPESP